MEPNPDLRVRPTGGRDKRVMPADATDVERNAEHWRRLEADARLIALTMTDAERRRVMLFIAEGYKILAERAELRDTYKK